MRGTLYMQLKQVDLFVTSMFFISCEVKFCQIDFCKSKLDYTLWKKNCGEFKLKYFPHLLISTSLIFMLFTRSIQKLSFRCLFCFELMCLFLFMWHGFFIVVCYQKQTSLYLTARFFFQYFIIIFFLNFLT